MGKKNFFKPPGGRTDMLPSPWELAGGIVGQWPPHNFARNSNTLSWGRTVGCRTNIMG